MSEYKVGYKKPPKEHQFGPGNNANPSGRPKMPISLVKALQNRLNDNPELANDIIDSWLEQSKYQFPAIRELLDRIDGKVASEVHFKGVMAHIGDDYAQLGLEANKKALEERKMKYLGGNDGQKGTSEDSEAETA